MKIREIRGRFRFRSSVVVLGEAIAVSNFIYLYIHLGRHHVYRIETCNGKDLEPFLRKERRGGP